MFKLIFSLMSAWAITFLLYLLLRQFVLTDSSDKVKVLRGLFVGVMTALLGCLTLVVVVNVF